MERTWENREMMFEIPNPNEGKLNTRASETMNGLHELCPDVWKIPVGWTRATAPIEMRWRAREIPGEQKVTAGDRDNEDRTERIKYELPENAGTQWVRKLNSKMMQRAMMRNVNYIRSENGMS